MYKFIVTLLVCLSFFVIFTMLVKQYNVESSDGYISRISLVNEHCIPICPYSVIFLNCWINQGALTSKRRVAYELRFFLLYLSKAKPSSQPLMRGIDIINRAKSGVFLSAHECRAFTDSCRYKHSSMNSNIVPMKTFSNKMLQNAIHSANISKLVVSESTRKGRIKTALNFLECLYEELHGKYRAPESVAMSYHESVHELKAALGRKTPKSTDCQFEESKIPAHIYMRLLEIIQVDSPDNPFKHSKLRNYIIVQLLLETGERRGAISKLKISNCKFNGSGDEIQITRTPNDLADKRTDKPSQKTKSHSAYVPKNLMKKIDEYIEFERSRYRNSEQHEFVFIAEMNSKGTSGDPLNQKSINNIFKILSSALGFNIHPHLARHKWNEVFSEQTEGMNREHVDKLRKYTMGWTKDSGMTEVYNRFKDAVDVRNIQQRRQQELSPEKEPNE